MSKQTMVLYNLMDVGVVPQFAEKLRVNNLLLQFYRLNKISCLGFE